MSNKDNETKVNKNNKAWEILFEKHDILKHIDKQGYFDITAEQINVEREARLMAKIDTRDELPTVMKRNKLAMLAINNGTYRIGYFDPFIDIPPAKNTTPISADFPQHIITITPQKLNSESAILDASQISGVLEKVFGEKTQLTIRGRLKAPKLKVAIGNHTLDINGVQIEVDGGYEGMKTINLVEAKIKTRTNLSLRQIAYPQLAWEHNAQGRKIVRTFLCLYEEPKIRFIPIIYENHIYKADIDNEKIFQFEPAAKLRLQTIKVDSNLWATRHGIPFPQADRFDTILAILTILAAEKEITKDDLFSHLDIELDPRQMDYYSNVLRWLGLAAIKKENLVLSMTGQEVAAMSHANRMMYMAKTIFSEPIFNYALHNPGKEIPKTMFHVWKCGPKTIARRTQTVRAWIRYFQEYTKRTV